ncbi:MAG: MaoC family dehydratase N-terminal domain-containing protein [Sphingomonas sp.]
MWAGSTIRFGRALRTGDEIERISRIEAVEAKLGRSGALCFVTVRHVFEAGGEMAVEEHQDIVYREPATGTGRPPSAHPAPSGTWSAPCQAGPTLLFRYSALTFNGHRIHYDRRFAVEEEQYPGLVVHGPLQATLLLNYASALMGGRALSAFAFRSTSALFDDDRFSLNAEKTGEDAMRLWTARERGAVAMTAEARWT